MVLNSTNNLFNDLILDDEEAVIEAALERGEFEETPEQGDVKKMLNEAASRYRHLNNSKPITLRINQLDLIKIKAKAKRSNIPYQTLLGAIVHDFAENKEELKIK